MNTLDRALYRGKRVDTGEWVEGSLLACRAGAYIFHEGLDVKVDPKTVGQWLGTTDNKGVKAFEGDIAEHHVAYEERNYYGHGDESKEISEYFTGIVAYQPSRGAILKVKKMRDDCGDGEDVKCIQTKNFYASRAAIIGNIHDNPELIEVS